MNLGSRVPGRGPPVEALPVSDEMGVGSLSLWVILASSILAWSMLDCRPPGWDQSGHLTASVEYSRAMAAGPVAFARTLLRAPSWYPPFYHLVLATVFAVFGVFSWAPAAVNCLFAGVLLYATWELGKKVYPDDDVVAFTATALTATSPLLAYVSHEALLDYALVALVALAVLAAARESTFTCPSAAASAGAAVATALLVKPTAALFLTVPLAGRICAGCRLEGSGRAPLPDRLPGLRRPSSAGLVFPAHVGLESSLPRESSRCRKGRGSRTLHVGERRILPRGLYRLDFAPSWSLPCCPECFGPSAAGGEPRYLWAWIVPAWLTLTFLMAEQGLPLPPPCSPRRSLARSRRPLIASPGSRPSGRRYPCSGRCVAVLRLALWPVGRARVAPHAARPAGPPEHLVSHPCGRLPPLRRLEA